MKGVLKGLIIMLKIGLFGVVVWLLLQHISWAELRTALTRFSPLTIAGVVVCEILRQVVLGLRMYYAARLVGIQIPILKLLRWDYEIIFLEQVIPLPNAEDIFRIFFWEKQEGTAVSNILTALLFSRVCGLVTISLLLPVTIYVMSKNILQQSGFPLCVWWCVPLLIFITILFHKKALQLLANGISRIKFIPASIPNTIHLIIQKNIPLKHYVFCCGLTAFQFVFVSGAFYVLIAATGAQVSYLQIFLASPIIVLAFLVPFSVQGLGVPEAVMVWVMVHYGVQPSTAAAVSIVHFACYILLILLAGVLVLLNADNTMRDLKQFIKKYTQKKPPQEVAATAE